VTSYEIFQNFEISELDNFLRLFHDFKVHLTHRRQNPQCEGHNKDRIFFNKKVPGSVLSSHAVFFQSIALAKRRGLERLPHVVPAKAKDISYVLRFAARWNWHVQRKNTVSRPFTRMVDLEFTRLEQVGDDFDGQACTIMKPMGENMIGVVESLRVVEMDVKPNLLFG
jgi:hypothetical protein